MKYPFAYVAGATGAGGRWENSYAGLANDLVAGGFKTVLLMDRYARKEQVDHFKSRGLAVWAWEEPGHGISVHNSRFQDMCYDGVVLQTENPGQRDWALAEFRDGLAAGKERHIVTYYFSFDDGHGAEYWNAFKAAGVTKMHVEHYAPDHTNDTARYIGQGVHYGIPAEDIIVVFGVYRGETPASYTTVEAAGRNFGVYIVDDWKDASMGDPAMTTWKTWGALNAALPEPPKPEPPVTLPNPADLNAHIAATAHTWLDPQAPNTMPLTRLRSIARIAETSDEEWVARRQDVVDALDGKVAALRLKLASAESALADATAKIKAAKAALG